MEIFWGLIVAVLFFVIVAALLVIGGRYLRLRTETERQHGELESSTDRPEDRGRRLEEERKERGADHGEAEQ